MHRTDTQCKPGAGRGRFIRSWNAQAMWPLEVVSVPVAERPHWGSVGPFVGRTMRMQNGIRLVVISLGDLRRGVPFLIRSLPGFVMSVVNCNCHGADGRDFTR